MVCSDIGKQFMVKTRENHSTQNWLLGDIYFKIHRYGHFRLLGFREHHGRANRIESWIDRDAFVRRRRPSTGILMDFPLWKRRANIDRI